MLIDFSEMLDTQRDPKVYCFEISLCVAFNLTATFFSSDMISTSMPIFDILWYSH